MAAPTGLYRLQGALGSPFSMKMRAVLRHRRIQHLWEGGKAGFAAAQTMKAKVIPVLVFPDGQMENDSTHLIALLEAAHPERRLTPDDPAAAFLSLLIEDMADEWFSKAMYAYRWSRPVDQEQCCRWLAFDVLQGGGAEMITQMGASFRDRQIARMARVGCGPDARPAIEASAARIMSALDAHVVERPYLFGSRPSAADFALYGQLTQLASDPTPQALMRQSYPWLYRWTLRMDDLSGEPEGDWSDVFETSVLTALLTECGSHHLPLLIANARAIQAGDASFSHDMDGVAVVQDANRYPVKCLMTLRAAWAALPDDARTRLTPLLAAAKALDALDASELEAVR